jgi:hypothetical protein
VPNWWSGTLNFEIDLDSNSTSDIKFEYTTGGGPIYTLYSAYVYPKSSVEFATINGNSSWIDSLSKGTLIDSSLNWNTCSSGGILKYVYQYWGPITGYFNYGVFYGTNKYLGFRIPRTGDTLYGWIFLDVTANGLMLKAYSINNYKTAIGFTELAIPKHNTIIYPNPSTETLTVVQENQVQKYLELYDSNGELISNTIRPNEPVDISNLPNGMYFIKTPLKSGFVFEKFIIRR